IFLFIAGRERYNRGQRQPNVNLLYAAIFVLLAMPKRDRQPKSAPAPASPDLARLVNAARRGDAQAYTDLVKHFSGMAYSLALGLLNDEHAAQDVAQEAFITVYQQLSRLREPEAFGAWLRRVVVMRCRLAIRRKKPTASDGRLAIAQLADPQAPAPDSHSEA